MALLLNSFTTESLNSNQTKQRVNIRERFRHVVKKSLNVMRALRAFRVAGKTCRTENVDEHAERSTNEVITNGSSASSTKHKIVDQSDSGTHSRGMYMTSSKHFQRTFRGHDEVLPRCLPKFCCKCFDQEKKNHSTVHKALVFSRTKVLSIVEHRYFDAFILFIIFISSVSLVSSV